LFIKMKKTSKETKKGISKAKRKQKQFEKDLITPVGIEFYSHIFEPILAMQELEIAKKILELEKEDKL